MTAPPVTVVVASYNHATYLPTALGSTLAQTHPDVRLVVTDDASRDDSVAVLTAWLAEHDVDAATILHATNRGICRTFNEALDAVSTPYYTVMSADDVMRPDRLATQVASLERLGERYAASYSDARLIDENGVPTGRTFADEYRFAGQEQPSGDVFLALCGGNWIPAPSVLLRTAAVRGVGGYDETQAFEDYPLWLRLARDHLVDHVADPLVDYRVHGEQMTLGLAGGGRMGLDLTLARMRHLGHDPEADAVILDEAEGKLRHAYLSGTDPAGLARPLAVLAGRRPTTANRVLATAARAHLPGRVVGRVGRVGQKVKGGRR